VVDFVYITFSLGVDLKQSLLNGKNFHNLCGTVIDWAFFCLGNGTNQKGISSSKGDVPVLN